MLEIQTERQIAAERITGQSKMAPFTGRERRCKFAELEDFSIMNTAVSFTTSTFGATVFITEHFPSLVEKGQGMEGTRIGLRETASGTFFAFFDTNDLGGRPPLSTIL